MQIMEENIEETREERMSYLINEYYQRIYVYCFHILRNQQDAEDAVQEVFIKAFQNNKLMTIDYYSAWLYKIAYHHCLNKVKRRSFFQLVTFDTRHHRNVAHTVSDDLELEEIMCKLKAKERALLLLRIIEDKDFAEIALILNITPATARKRFERVKEKVQALIERGGHND
ncbi:RNA polymerase sigma factor [Lysinibacillus piscis]|uniref:RNA polymerase sigma factor n=1 Tax=Lysinibacillus piscis TaxID=2518931 RepID=A0ABQ5NMD7_9BACI|nr:sigma-70 family RNA polymerase sigma factor [Lysinibacillus sp. KH24]GLC89521.1 RNA polymerase sigma factor [Lysinibacillus sp. KH24]